MSILSFVAVLGGWGIGMANADIPLPPVMKECHYLTQNTVQVKCGLKVTPVSCLAKNGRCPEKARDCAEDPQVEFVKTEGSLPPVIMNSNGVQNGGNGK